MMLTPGEAYLLFEVLEKRCNTQGRCYKIDTKPDASSNKKPFNAFSTHRLFTFLTCDCVTVNCGVEICLDLRQIYGGLFFTTTVEPPCGHPAQINQNAAAPETKAVKF